MKKTTLTFTLIAIYTISFGQSKVDSFFPYKLNKIETDQACFFGMTEYTGFEQLNLYSQKQLPVKIRSKARKIINSTMAGFISRVNFIGANVIDLDSRQKEDTLSEIDKSIPKYELHFQLCDPLLGIKSYCVTLNFDQYGKLINYNWPTDSYSIRAKFLKPNVIKKKALEFAKHKKYKTKKFISELVYEKKLNMLCWHVSFWQKTTYQKNGHTEIFNTIIIDATSTKHIRECGTELTTVTEDYLAPEIEK
jgi:hypothetical protein